MKTPKALKILKELNQCERTDIIFNGLRSIQKKKEVKEALSELREANR